MVLCTVIERLKELTYLYPLGISDMFVAQANKFGLQKVCGNPSSLASEACHSLPKSIQFASVHCSGSPFCLAWKCLQAASNEHVKYAKTFTDRKSVV